ncbi:MAG TPA: GNAT family N-acetyltransferase [Candidatus Limnocylindrales bacterium]|nr:GNAT family N-acetyltransferase [Candidatus Limnocylindrales bacterium]
MTAAPLLPEIEVDDRAPVADVRAFLERDRVLAAYALADLDSENIDTARWWAARSDGEVIAVALLVEILPFRPCFAMGAAPGLTQIFREGIRESRLLLATPVAGRPAIELAYRFERADLMHRMAVDVATFRPRVAHPITRLGPEHLEDVIDLYGNASRTYFTPRRLLRELYFGIYQGGALAAAAGTHVRSEEGSVAAVGNVLTRLPYRGRGMATSVTSAVTEAALERHRDVALNVRQENASAIAVYRRLGYRVHAPFIEGLALRRTPWDRLTKQILRRH